MHNITLVHRYWNEGSRDHFYTIDPTEIGTTTPGHKGHHGYRFEGSTFSIFTQEQSGLVPVYRGYHQKKKDHFYTTNLDEIGVKEQGMTGKSGYTHEGILGYVSPHEFPGSVAIYRYFQKSSYDHFYTTNASEIGTTNVGHKGNHDYIYEGILGFVHPNEDHFSLVHRYWNDDIADHFYTTNPNEIGTVVPGAVGNHGYKFEASPFLVFTHHHAGLNAIYRYYHEGKRDHLYNADAAEIGTSTAGQVGKHGYKFENILGYLSPHEFFGSSALYRYHQGKSNDHFYTIDPEEIGTTTVGEEGKHGYKCEGIVGYVIKPEVKN